MTTRIAALLQTLAVAGGLAATPVLAQHDAHHAPTTADVGRVAFATSCTPAIADDFNRSVALLHSFWFPEAIAGFEGVLATDPNCAMALWGVALAQWGNPFGGNRTADNIAKGRAAADRATATGSPTPRERAYIEAVAALYTSPDASTQRARVLAYERGMAQVVAAAPDDVEAKIFHALAITQTAVPTDKSYAPQLKAAAILEPLFEAQPAHPGLAHYIIHAYDYPPLADKALVAARRYASLAPGVPHALHMPSHTFTRVGSWGESIETNRRSAETARASSSFGDELHALDYQVYAHLQLAQDAAARAAIARAESIVGSPAGSAVAAAGSGSFAVAAMPARYALERGRWDEAAALTVRPAKTPYTEAITRFARAIGAARIGHPDQAAPEIARLAELRTTLVEMSDAYWAEQVDIQRRIASAWVTFAQGRKGEAVTELSAAADAEDATDKAAVTPGPIAPARELLGFMLLEAGDGKAALAAFEATMAKEPNRFRAIYGAARAAAAAGDTAKRDTYVARLNDLAKSADGVRPELAEVRRTDAARE